MNSERISPFWVNGYQPFSAYKLLYYNLSDGKFIHSVPLDMKVENPVRNVMFSSCINTAQNTYYLWTDMADYTLYRCDDKEMTGLKPNRYFQLGMKKFYSNYQSEYLYCPDYGEFGISTVDGKKRFFVDFGSDALPEEMKPKTMKDFQKLEQSPYFKAIMNVQESQSGIYISALSPKTNYYDIYIDKSSGQMLKGDTDPKSYLNVVQVEVDSFYALFYPYFVEDDSPLKKELAKYGSFSDNPVLIKFRINLNDAIAG